MKLSDINKTSIKKVSDKELLNLHWRIHMIYTSNKKNKVLVKKLIDYHEIVVNEMIQRGFKHNSPLLTTPLKSVMEK